MSINVAFKIHEALVFCTDGLATLSSVDMETGQEHIVSSVPDVEKLVVLSAQAESAGTSVLAMFNGIGSLGNGSVAGELRAYDRQQPRRDGEPMADYAGRLATYLADAALGNLGSLPRPFHLILGGFNRPKQEPARRAPAQLFSIEWPRSGDPPVPPRPVLHSPPGDDFHQHSFGVYYAGATQALSRFVEGFDPALPEEAVALLAGLSPESHSAPPGILEELIHEARRMSPAAPDLLPNREVQALALKYAGRIVKELFVPEAASLSAHFSLQAAINYSVFLAQCAYARESFSPARQGPARVGSPLQVAYLLQDRPAVQICGITPGVSFQNFLIRGDAP